MSAVELKPANGAHFFQASNCKRYATQLTSQNLCNLKKADTATRCARKFLAGILPVALTLAGLSAYSQSRRGRTTPSRLEGTFSDGIISSVRTSDKLIQHTAPISPGSSGGPLLDEYGKVIGVNTLALREAQNLNFAVPAVYLKTFVEQVKNRKVLARTLPRSPDRPVAARRASPPRTESESPGTEPDDVEARAKSDPPINTSPPIVSKAPAPEKAPSLRERIDLTHVDLINKRYRSAETALLDIFKENPDLPRVNYLLGQVYFETKQYEKSIPYLAKAVDRLDYPLERDHAKRYLGEAYVFLGKAYFGTRKYEESVSYLEKALAMGAPVTLPIAHHRRSGPNNDLNNGEIVLQKDSIEFRRSSPKTRTGAEVSDESFKAPLSSINELKYEQGNAERLKIGVVIQRTGKKEDRRTYNFHPIEAIVRRTGIQGFSVSETQIECFSCAQTTKIIYRLLSNIKK